MMNNKIPKLEDIIEYQFIDKSFLELALVHRSALNEAGVESSNERLEFLGDAVLEVLVSEYLYLNNPTEPEGVLTAARSAIVRTESLAEVAKKISLGENLRMSKGEEKSGGRANTSLLANAFEALVGAIFLDGGIASAKGFFERFLVPQAKLVMSGSLKDAKSLLQERVQEKGFPAPVYHTIQEIGPDHEKTFVVAVSAMGEKQLALGRGKNKQSAQQQAARQALKKLKKTV